MAMNFLQQFSWFFFMFLVFVYPISGHTKKGESGPFEFLKGLQGCHKGDNINGIHKLKDFLHKFGYLDYNEYHHNSNITIDDHFDDILESALKTYQFDYHIKPTGVLDATTVAKMVMPRCGVPDIVNGNTRMRSATGKPRHKNRKGSSRGISIHTVSHYSFFPNSPRWPPTKTHLTYAFSSTTPAQARAPMVRAFEKWAAATHFTFSQVQSTRSADMVIGFHRRDHGDGAPFDGPGGTIAHAFAPTNGRFHVDMDDSFSFGPRPAPNEFDMETVAVHEIGHLLGLGHSSVEDAIMYAYINPGVAKGLHQDDIQGIRALYNV